MPPTIPGLPASVADKLPAGLLDKVKKPLIAILVVIAGFFGLNAAGVFDGDDDKGDTPTTVVVDSTDATDDSSLTSMVDTSTSVDDDSTSTSVVDDSATSTSIDDSATSTSVDDSVTSTSIDVSTASSLPAAGDIQAAAAKTIVEGFAIEGIDLDPSCVAAESASLSDTDAAAVVASLNSDKPPTIEGGFDAFLERLIKCEVAAS